MQTVLVVAVYGAAAALALYLLYFFHAKAWYWHTLSVMAAVAIGLMPVGALPIPEAWMAAPATSLVTGFFFLFLLLWGVGGPFFRSPHPSRQARHA